MLPEIKKYASQYHLIIDPILANKIVKADKGTCESCDFTRDLYSVPFANFGSGAKMCLGCVASLLSEDHSPAENDNSLDD